MLCLVGIPRGWLIGGLIALSAWTTGSACAGEIFKCVAKDGTPLYQNFPCNIDSMGFAPSSPTAAAAAPAKTKATTDHVISAKLSKGSEVHAGMTTEQVTAIMGEPVEMVEDEPAVGGPVSNWRYADGRIVQFDHKHRVLGVQR